MSRTIAAVLISAVLAAAASAAPIYPAPTGGWTYTYTGDADAYVGATKTLGALDGQWMRGGNSDAWDGSAPGEVGPTPNGDSPGGAAVSGGILSIEDTGDPRGAGYSDPSNRKVFFLRQLYAGGDSGNAAEVGPTYLDDGVTLSFRARLNPSPLDMTGPDGYILHDGGKGPFGLRQAQDNKTISFGLALTSDDANVTQNGLVMNRQVDNTPGGDVDTDDAAGTLNLLPIADLTAWHEFWITVQADANPGWTHRVDVYMDGSLTPDTFYVTAGDGKDDPGDNYINIEQGSTGQSGALDVDFVSYATGSHVPVPEPATLALMGVGLSGLLLRRKRR
ncbi:MAG: PEP-CTERM sorting domain-containing protein [Phycisphaerae bacterium]